MILLSACLYGLPCRWDGASRRVPELLAELAGEPLLVVCPEQLGGLPVPRPPAEIRGADGAEVLAGRARVVRPEDGADATAAFLAGAQRCVELARACGVTRAVLKAKSPSCGVSGHVSGGRLRPGPGVTAAALRGAGVVVEERG